MIKLSCITGHPIPDEESRERLYKMAKLRMLTDMAFSSEKRFYPCHKIVVAYASCYVQAMMKFQLGVGDSKLLVVAVGDFEEVEMESLLQFLYFGTLVVDSKDFDTLSKLAQKLLIPLLADKLYDPMTKMNIQPTIDFENEPRNQPIKYEAAEDAIAIRARQKKIKHKRSTVPLKKDETAVLPGKELRKEVNTELNTIKPTKHLRVADQSDVQMPNFPKVKMSNNKRLKAHKKVNENQVRNTTIDHGLNCPILEFLEEPLKKRKHLKANDPNLNPIEHASEKGRSRTHGHNNDLPHKLRKDNLEELRSQKKILPRVLATKQAKPRKVEMIHLSPPIENIDHVHIPIPSDSLIQQLQPNVDKEDEEIPPFNGASGKREKKPESKKIKELAIINVIQPTTKKDKIIPKLGRTLDLFPSAEKAITYEAANTAGQVLEPKKRRAPRKPTTKNSKKKDPAQLITKLKGSGKLAQESSKKVFEDRVTETAWIALPNADHNPTKSVTKKGPNRVKRISVQSDSSDNCWKSTNVAARAKKRKLHGKPSRSVAISEAETKMTKSCEAFGKINAMDLPEDAFIKVRPKRNAFFAATKKIQEYITALNEKSRLCQTPS